MPLPHFTPQREGMNLGDLLKYEAPNLYSRDLGIIVVGQKLALGTVLGRAGQRLHSWDPAASDGSQIAIGVLAVDVDASLIESEPSLYIARHAIVATIALVWPTGITGAEKATATQQLEARGILIRASA